MYRVEKITATYLLQSTGPLNYFHPVSFLKREMLLEPRKMSLKCEKKKELKVFIIPNGTDCPETTTLVTLASFPALVGVQSTQEEEKEG